MSKLLLSALMLAFLLVPAAQGQQQAAYTVDVAIEDLPASAVTNGTVLTIPFNVTANVSGASPCLGAASSGSTFTITLSAELVNSTGSSTFVNVNPKQHTISGPVLLPASAPTGARKSPATLLVDAGPYAGDALNATVKVTATFSGSNGGCTGVPASAPDSDEATFQANFEPTVGYGAPADTGQKMPGVGLGLTLVGLAALALIARRN